jgi:FKBP-type peptidyl-prolyl cis-trans isomerase 2
MKPGDVIEFDYDLFVEGHKTLYDTTNPEKAKAAGIGQEGAYYAPMRYVIGSGRLIPGLEAALLKAEAGKPFEITIPAAEAYGERDPARIETIPMAEFKKNKVEPKEGLVITWKNRRGAITQVGGGRVRVDFNAPLAGKALTYKVKVNKVFTEEADKVKGLLLMNYPSPESPKVVIEPGKPRVAVVTLPETAMYDPNWSRAKFGFLSSVQLHTEIGVVRLVEEHKIERQPPPAPAESSPAKTE